jgi:hypothetical protein
MCKFLQYLVKFTKNFFLNLKVTHLAKNDETLPNNMTFCFREHFTEHLLKI